MKSNLLLFSIFISILLHVNLGYSQCTGCTTTISASSASAITVAAGTTTCIVASGGPIILSGTVQVSGTLCINASAGDVTISGGMTLSKNGTIVMYSGSSYKVMFTGSYNENAPGSVGDRFIINNGNFEFPAAAGWTPFKSAITNNGYMNISGGLFRPYGNFTNTGTLNVLTDLNFNSGITITNSGTITSGGNFVLATGDVLTNSGTINTGGSFTSNSGASFTNTSNWNITGDATLNGNYNNSGVFHIGGLLTLNASGTVNIQGGLFYSGDLVFNSGVVNAGTGCAAFIVTNSTAVQSSTFTVGSGIVDVTDLSDPGSLNISNCPAGPPANCGLSLSGSTATNSCMSALPISLYSFKGNYISEDQVSLTWVTLSEQNNLSFLIDQTTDFVNFTPVATVNGAVNSNLSISYNYVDSYSGAEEVYYRLRSRDIDGSTHDLGFVAPKKSSSKISIYPNPSNGQFNVTYQGYQKIYYVHIYDMSGNLVYVKNDFANTLEKILNVNTTGLDGVYFISIATEEGFVNEKITLIAD